MNKACALVTFVLAAVAGAADAGLLKVPRVYNALITSNEPLLPSRAYPVSSPVVLVSSPYVALEPAYASPDLPTNSSEPEDPPTTGPPAPAEPGSTPEPPPMKAEDGMDSPPLPYGSIAPLPYGSAAPFPLTFYSPLGYSPFSYYPSFLAYSYPFVSPGVSLPFPLPQAAAEASPPSVPSSPNLPSSADPVKNNKPQNSDVPDVSPPPPPSGAARADNKEAMAEAA